MGSDTYAPLNPADEVITCAQPSHGGARHAGELSMVEQRYNAIREVLDGATVTHAAIRYIN
jgi:hypothetical protein